MKTWGDIEDLEVKFRQQEHDRLKASGKVWTRGEPLDGLYPHLRVFVEKTLRPGIKYPLIMRLTQS